MFHASVFAFNAAGFSSIDILHTEYPCRFVILETNLVITNFETGLYIVRYHSICYFDI